MTSVKLSLEIVLGLLLTRVSQTGVCKKQIINSIIKMYKLNN